MSDVYLDTKSRMDHDNNKKMMPSVPSILTQRIGDNGPLREVNIKATKYSYSSNETLMQNGIKTSSNANI